jgi:hypothetical protein
MALSVPLVSDLLAFKQEQYDESLQVPMQTHLQIATDIMSLATGVTEDLPADTPLGRLFRIAILDLAWYIGTSLEERDAMFSPFSSERIGSYSYSKAMSAARTGASLGVPFFDMVVALIADSSVGDEAGSILLTTAQVMPTVWSEHLSPQTQATEESIDFLG